jgi:hypothetical protein
LVIPPPFEVGQQVGLGAVTIVVSSFRRVGDVVTVRVAVGNAGPHSVAVPSAAFTVFYNSGRQPARRVTGLGRSIAPNAHEMATLEFAVPAQYQFPLVWFDASIPGAHAGTIVLRGAASG